MIEMIIIIGIALITLIGGCIVLDHIDFDGRDEDDRQTKRDAFKEGSYGVS